MSKLLFKILIPFIFLSYHVTHAQTIKTPEFPAPERQFYDLLEEGKVTNPRAMNGSVKAVEVASSLYGQQGQKASGYSISTLLDKQGNITGHRFFENGEEQKSYLSESRQEIDSVDGHLRITIHKQEEGFREYLYKNNRLAKQVHENGMDDTWEQVYSYDDQGRLVQKRTYTHELLVDENNELIAGAKKEVDTEIVTYDGDRLLTKARYSFWDEVINIDKIEYKYNPDGHCTQYNYHYDRYLTDNLDWAKPLELQTYTQANQVAGEETHLTGKFTFNAVGYINTFVLTDLDYNDFTEQYEVSYFFNKMTVKASFQDLEEGAQKPSSEAVYEYTYDRHKNPVNIVSYISENGKKRLDKETTLKITYYQE